MDREVDTYLALCRAMEQKRSNPALHTYLSNFAATSLP